MRLPCFSLPLARYKGPDGSTSPLPFVIVWLGFNHLRVTHGSGAYTVLLCCPRSPSLQLRKASSRRACTGKPRLYYSWLSFSSGPQIRDFKFHRVPGGNINQRARSGDLNSISAFGQKFQQVHLCLPGTSRISGVARGGSRRRVVVIVLMLLFAINNPSLPLCRLTGFITRPAKNSKSVPQVQGCSAIP